MTSKLQNVVFVHNLSRYYNSAYLLLSFYIQLNKTEKTILVSHIYLGKSTVSLAKNFETCIHIMIFQGHLYNLVHVSKSGETKSHFHSNKAHWILIPDHMIEDE